MRRTYAYGEPAVEELSVAGLPVPVKLKRHPRARRMTLRVSQSHGGVILTLPHDCHYSDADQFVAKHVDWIKRHLDELPTSVPFTHGAVIPFRGEDYELEFVGARRRGGVVWTKPVQEDFFGQLFAEEAAASQNTLPKLCVAGQVEHAPRRLRDWLIAQAKADLRQYVAWHANNLKLSPKRITIRDQTTRWGSCSSTGALSFSWRLVLAPPKVLEYVAAHEVAHLQEMNHSHRFWDLCRKTMPDMDAPKNWLRDNGVLLHAYGS